MKQKLFKLMKARIIRVMRSPFEQQEKKYYYKPKRVRNFWKNNYIAYVSDKNMVMKITSYQQ